MEESTKQETETTILELFLNIRKSAETLFGPYNPCSSSRPMEYLFNANLNSPVYTREQIIKISTQQSERTYLTFFKEQANLVVKPYVFIPVGAAYFFLSEHVLFLQSIVGGTAYLTVALAYINVLELAAQGNEGTYTPNLQKLDALLKDPSNKRDIESLAKKVYEINTSENIELLKKAFTEKNIPKHSQELNLIIIKKLVACFEPEIKKIENKKTISLTKN